MFDDFPVPPARSWAIMLHVISSAIAAVATVGLGLVAAGVALSRRSRPAPVAQFLVGLAEVVLAVIYLCAFLTGAVWAVSADKAELLLFSVKTFLQLVLVIAYAWGGALALEAWRDGPVRKLNTRIPTTLAMAGAAALVLSVVYGQLVS